MLGSHAKTTTSKINLNPLTSESKQLLCLNISQIQFSYEAFNKNLANQNQQFYYGIFELYDNLNKLGEILYQDKNLFFHSINEVSDIDYIIDLSKTLDTLEERVKLLKSTAKEIDLKALEKNILTLSKDILLYLSCIKENLRPYIENVDFIMRSAACRNPSLNSNSETGSISEVESLDSEQEEEDNHLDRNFSARESLSYKVVLSKGSLSDEGSESGYFDNISSQFFNLNSSEAQKDEKNNPAFFNPC